MKGYERPVLMRLGSVEALTLDSNLGSRYDNPSNPGSCGLNMRTTALSVVQGMMTIPTPSC